MADLWDNSYYMSSQTKRQLGQFYTKRDLWLLPNIAEFIHSTNAKIAYDPFVGNGDLIDAIRPLGLTSVVGLDIEPRGSWRHNDSLASIPRIANSVVITNPPYLSNYSAKRKGLYDNIAKYFANSAYDDLYLIAIEKCMSNDYGVMIVPETFINSSFPKQRLHSITVLEENPFEDTETPVCVICFDKNIKESAKIGVFKNERYIGTLKEIQDLRLIPTNNRKIKFNKRDGKIALRAVDTTDPLRPISFMRKEQLDYDLAGIKHSSRLITIISVSVADSMVDPIIADCNEALRDYRKRTHDILLSPFKGNRKDGVRRRRLDYATARAIMESVCSSQLHI